jgi:hypothetical protein
MHSRQGRSGAQLCGVKMGGLDAHRGAGRTLLASGVVRIESVRDTAGAARSSRAAPGRWTAASMPWTRPTSPPTASCSRKTSNAPRPTAPPGDVERVVVSCYGQQRLTCDGAGEDVYGGSDLTLVRGDFEALRADAGLSQPLRHAIDQARRYHRGVIDCYPEFFASRMNYDVARNVLATGRSVDARGQRVLLGQHHPSPMRQPHGDAEALHNRWAAAPDQHGRAGVPNTNPTAFYSQVIEW